MTPLCSDEEAVALSRRLEGLVHELEAAQNEPMVARARELGRLLTELHGAGLARIVGALAADHRPALDRLLDDDLVASLLVLHDLHPEPVRTRVERALARVGRLARLRFTLVELGASHARVRAEGNAGPGGRSSAALEELVRDAVQAVAPELERIEVEGSVAPSALVQITVARAASPVPGGASP